MTTQTITSVNNPLVKDLVRLRQHRVRSETGTFLVEGYRELRRAVQAALPMETLFICPSFFLGVNEPDLVATVANSGARVIELGEEAFRKVSYRDRPEGLLAKVPMFATDLARVEAGGWFLVVESIEKPGNLGTMLRTADAAGVGGVIVCDPTTDVFNPNVVRSSLGTLFSVPLAVESGNAVRSWLAEHQVRIVATSPQAPHTLWEASYRGRVAVVIGSEQYGLSEGWLQIADQVVKIPMAGSIDSLNAAAAAAIVLFEAVRDRTQIEPSTTDRSARGAERSTSV